MSAICEQSFGSPESETCGMCIRFMSGNREISEGAVGSPEDSRAGGIAEAGSPVCRLPRSRTGSSYLRSC